jgi:hypothetical protein
VNGELIDSVAAMGTASSKLAVLMRQVADEAHSSAKVREIVSRGAGTIRAALDELRSQYRWHDAFMAKVP